jgi:hypothetical protein
MQAFAIIYEGRVPTLGGNSLTQYLTPSRFDQPDTYDGSS